MSRIYDNWEKLVAAVVKKQQLWELFHDQSRSPSIRSEASDFSSSSSSPIHDVAFDILCPGSSSRWEEAFTKSHPKLVFVSDFSPALDVDDVFLAYFGWIWSENFWSLYKVVMKNGVTIAVKRLKRGITTEAEFKRNMAIVGNVQHENVVSLRAYYSSEDERLMLYDYYSKWSVFDLLHGRTGRNRSVDWETRLRIAIGAARGITEIHAQNGGKFVHGDINASNVYLNSQQYGCISALGLEKMIVAIFSPTTLYYAPEVKNTCNISQASDVYSFGVFLLELLTRKSPVPTFDFPRAVDLVKLVTSVKSKEWAAKVFDADLLNHPEIKDQMVKLLQIGMRCVAKSPKKRPVMSVVVKKLVEISTTSTETPVSLKKELVFVQDTNPFDFNDLLQASAVVLGEGTFGTSYKASLKNGTTIMVKRLKNVNVTFKVFQQHVEVLGRVRHENVAELRAYYFSDMNNVLVYGYYNQDNLYTVLHGTNGNKKASLDWEARLKIATGAARGIAHIHRQESQSFVHGNIKSSNIFVNGQKYGLVSDAGIAKLTSPIRSSGLLSPGHCAPEVTNTRRVSQASDVYSFGVVLLELVTGKPSQYTTNYGEISLVKWVQAVIREEWTGEVFDLKFLKDDNDEATLQLLRIGMDCVATEPESRPKMAQVVKILEEISGVYTVNQPSVESRLEDLLEDFLPTVEELNYAI